LSKNHHIYGIVAINGKMIKEVYERLCIETDLEQEKLRFFNRLNLTLEEISNQMYYVEDFFTAVSFELGVDRKLHLQGYLRRNYLDSFDYNLAVSETILKILREYNSERYIFLKDRLEKAIDNSMIDLGIIFKNDMFIKKGVEILDRAVLIDPLDWLKDYPNTKEYFKGALNDYLTKDYEEAMTKAYSALESLVKTVLDSDKRLDKLIDPLLSHLKLEPKWGGVLAQFCGIAHEFSTRHGERESKKKEDIDPAYAEAYMYFTGVMIRLILQSKNRSI